MNTPEQIINNNLNKIQAQLVQNHIRRIQPRDYGRILRDYNTPAQWYRPVPLARSIYFYDPNYQKYLQQQSQLPPTIRSWPSPIRANNPSTTCRKYPPTKQIFPSRLQTVPILPPIMTNKKPNDK